MGVHLPEGCDLDVGALWVLGRVSDEEPDPFPKLVAVEV